MRASPALTGSARQVSRQVAGWAAGAATARRWPSVLPFAGLPHTCACPSVGGRRRATLGLGPCCSEPGVRPAAGHPPGSPLSAGPWPQLRPTTHLGMSTSPQEVKFNKHCHEHANSEAQETLGKPGVFCLLDLSRFSHVPTAQRCAPLSGVAFPPFM